MNALYKFTNSEATFIQRKIHCLKKPSSYSKINVFLPLLSQGQDLSQHNYLKLKRVRKEKLIKVVFLLLLYFVHIIIHTITFA